MATAVCIRYLLFFFNLIFALVGLSILVIGGVSQYYVSTNAYYSPFMETTLVYVPIILLVIGGIIAVVAFFGCCGALRESHCMVTVFGSLLVLLLFLEIAVAVVAFIYHDDVLHAVEQKMQQGISDYYTDESVQKMIDGMQFDLQCCGVKGPSDYSARTPASCCPAQAVPATQCDDPWQSGCLTIIENMAINIGYIWGYSVLAVLLIQVLGIVFAFYLARTIKRGYEIV